MDRLVAVDPFVHQARERLSYRGLIAERGLILDDDVKGCMQPRVGNSDPRVPVVALDQSDTLQFLHLQPLFCGGLSKWIIALHHQNSRGAKVRAKPDL